MSGHQGSSGDVRDVLGAGREHRYSGTRSDIGGIRGYWGVGGVGAFGAVRGHQGV